MKPKLKLLCKKFNDDAVLPMKKRNTDEGYDVYSLDNLVIQPGETIKTHTGIGAMAIESHAQLDYCPRGDRLDDKIVYDSYWIQIEGRSSMAAKGIFPVGGIVDSGYTGEISIMLANVSNESYTINKGDRIAQLVPRRHHHFEVEEIKEFPETDRAAQGFASSGR